MKTTAIFVTPELGLVLEENMITTTHVETKLVTGVIITTSTSRPWDTSWCSDKKPPRKKICWSFSFITTTFYFSFFFYHSKRFTTITPFGVTTKPLTLTEGRLGLNHRKTKLPSYWNASFSKICLGMKIGQQINFIVINQQANSLYSLISDRQYGKTSLGRDMWKTLMGSKASLQNNR